MRRLETVCELTNASNANTFGALESGLPAGTVAIRAYGRQKADCEAQASWNVYEILTQRHGYQPSAWGTGHINACHQYGNLGAFQTFFRAAPHKSGTQPGDPKGLPTEEFYAFNASLILAGTAGSLDRQFTTITHARDSSLPKKRLSLQKLLGKLGSLSSQVNTKNNKAAAY